MVEGSANKLKDLRRQNGYSQKQVADKLMVSPSIISGYENSERTPSVEILLKLAHLYRCSTDFLLGLTTKTPVEHVELCGLTAQERQSIRILVQSLKEKQGCPGNSN